MNAGLTLTRQTPASAIATVRIGDRTPTEVWGEIVDSWTFTESIIEAIRVSGAGKSPNNFRDELDERDLPLGYDELAVRIAKGEENAVWRLARDLRTVAEGASSFDDALGVTRLLEGVEDAPTVAVRMESGFFDRRADQRRAHCRLLASLARTCDVRLVATGVVHRRLAAEHREELPGISEQCNTHRQELPTEAAAEQARVELDHDSREVALLRDLAENPAKNLSLHALKAEAGVSRSRISQCVSRLVDLELVATFETSEGKHVELLESGSAFLSLLDEEIGRQAELDSCVSDSGKSSKYSRVSTQREGGQGRAYTDRRQHGTAVNVGYMPRWRQAAATGAATDGRIAFVDHPEQPSDDLRQPYLGYEDDRLVVGAEYTNPMQYWVCVARALTDRRVWADVLTPERLDGDIGNLGGLVTDDTRLLRDARCLGWLKDADAHGKGFAEALMDAEDDLLDLLRRLSNEDYDCSTREFRGIITSHALGMAGTVAHLCDLADVDLVRELRLPEFARRFDAGRREDLAESIVKSAQIQSRHGHFAAYRQLFEDRDEKRVGAMSPTIPADDPTGEMIGSFVIVGDGVTSFADELRDEFDESDVHEDAPEFDVRVPFEVDQGRDAVAATVRRALARKNLAATRSAIALFDGIAGSVYDIAQGIEHHLSAEDRPRDVRLDEVRRVLSHLPQERLLPTMQPTVRKLTKTLLTVASPLSKSELADRADVSTRSLRTHLPRLEALDLVSISEAGVRFTLPFMTDEERGRDMVPGLAKNGATAPIDCLYDLAVAISGEAAHDSETPIGAAFFSADPLGDLETLPTYRRWVALSRRLSVSGSGTDPETVTARFGPRSQQAALQEASA